MATSITTRKGLAAASTVLLLAACGGTPASEISGVDAGERTDSQPQPATEAPIDSTDAPTDAPTDSADAPTDSTGDPVPWSQLPDGDRIGRTHENPSGCDTFDTLLPC